MYEYYFRHGLGRTDFYILNDPELSFREIVQKNLLSAVSGSFTTEMFEAAKLETAKIETTKSEPVKTETIKVVSTTKSETVKSEVSKLEITKTEIADSEVKSESVEPQETQEEKIDAITSIKTEPINSESIVTEKIQDAENNTAEKDETPLNETSDEPMEVDNEEHKKPDISSDNSKEEQEVSSEIKTEQLLNESSKIVDQKKDEEKQKTSSSVENKSTDDQDKDIDNDKDKDESQSILEEKTVTSDDIESKIEHTNKEIKEPINQPTTNEIAVDTNNSKPDTKFIEQQTVKPKECSFPSVESVDKLKAMFPELEVLHKDISTPTVDKLPMPKPLQQIDQTIAHLLATSYQNPIKWPKVGAKYTCDYLFLYT